MINKSPQTNHKTFFWRNWGPGTFLLGNEMLYGVKKLAELNVVDPEGLLKPVIQNYTCLFY